MMDREAEREWRNSPERLRGRIEELEREKQDLAVGCAEYKRLYEAGCETWRPVFKQQADRIEELKRELDAMQDAMLTRDGARLLQHTRERALEEAAVLLDTEAQWLGGEAGKAIGRLAGAIRALKEEE